MRRAPAILFVSILLLAACGNGGGGGEPASGVRGIVRLGPVCPVEVAGGSPCPDIPFHGVVTASNASGEVARVETDLAGRFRMSLPPGTYTVVAVPNGTGALPAPVSRTVVVRVGSFTRISLEVDSGIR